MEQITIKYITLCGYNGLFVDTTTLQCGLMYLN